MDKLKKLWRNELFQTALMLTLVAVAVFGFWSGLRFLLGTEYPIVAVEGGSMCILPGPYCDGWSHPFERTLHDGDLVVLQWVNPKEIEIGDIIVYRRLSGGPVIHRVIEITVSADNKLLFATKGDGNERPDSPLVSQDDVVGRVVLRIPWLGHIALAMHSSLAVFITIVIIILLIVELVLPVLINRESGKNKKVHEKSAEET